MPWKISNSETYDTKFSSILLCYKVELQIHANAMYTQLLVGEDGKVTYKR